MALENFEIVCSLFIVTANEKHPTCPVRAEWPTTVPCRPCLTGFRDKTPVTPAASPGLSSLDQGRELSGRWQFSCWQARSPMGSWVSSEGWCDARITSLLPLTTSSYPSIPGLPVAQELPVDRKPHPCPPFHGPLPSPQSTELPVGLGLEGAVSLLHLLRDVTLSI